MSAFGGLIFTNKGRNLQAKAQAGAQLNFTRIAVGDGDLGGSSTADLNALMHQVKTIPITKLSVLTGGKAVVGGSFSNQDLITGFYWKELGVFATDPDLGEILYCYGNSGVNAEYIPAGGGPDVVEKSIDVVTMIGNAADVTATIEQSLIYYTQGDVLTVDQAQAPVSPGNGKISQLFNWLVNRIKAITGKANWYDTPTKSLEELNTAQATHEAEDASTTAKGHIQLATTVEATAGADATKAVTPAGVKAVINAVIAAAPGTLDTLNELAAALGDDPNFATTITALIGGKIDKSLADAQNDFLVASGPDTWVKKTLAEVRALLGCLLNTGFTMTSGSANFNDLEVIRPLIRDYAEKIGTTLVTIGTCTFDITTGNKFKVTPTGAIIIGFSNWPASGKAGSVTVTLKNGATVYAKTFAAPIKWVGDEIPDTSEPNKSYDFVFTTDDAGTVIHGACIGPYSA